MPVDCRRCVNRFALSVYSVHFMPLTSMTGFARTEGGLGDVRWHWELRAVNGKSLDVRLRTAPGFEALEAEFRALAAKYLRRGNCQLALQVSRENVASEIRINEAALQSVVVAVNRLAAEIDASPPSLDGLLAIKGVVELMNLRTQKRPWPPETRRSCPTWRQPLCR